MRYAALKGRSSTVIHTFVKFSAVYEIRTKFFGKLLEIDAAIEAQTQEETFFDCCLRGNRRYRGRLSLRGRARAPVPTRSALALSAHLRQNLDRAGGSNISSYGATGYFVTRHCSRRRGQS